MEVTSITNSVKQLVSDLKLADELQTGRIDTNYDNRVRQLLTDTTGSQAAKKVVSEQLLLKLSSQFADSFLKLVELSTQEAKNIKSKGGDPRNNIYADLFVELWQTANNYFSYIPMNKI
jgi:hypothetical protein